MLYSKCIGLRIVIAQMPGLIHWSQNCFQFLSMLKTEKNNIDEKPIIWRYLLFDRISLILYNK